MAYLSGYSKYKVLTITGGADGAQSNFQLKIAVSYEAAMDGEFDDIRFTQADGETLIDAWAEVIVTDTSATIWVEFPTTPANTVEQTYYMYYGNDGVVSDWDIGETFLFGTDFKQWDKYASNPVFSEYTGGVRFDDGYVYRSQIVKVGTGDYRMYYCGGHDALVDHRDNIGLATSSDLINWTRYNGSESENAIIHCGASGKFDYNRAWGPGTVIRESATSWKIWYTGDSLLGGTHVCRIGYATSSDGYSWTKYAGSEYGDAIFEDMDGASSGGRGAAIPIILKESDTDYKMWYQIYQNHKIKYATSSDGISWAIQNSGNAVITTEYSATCIHKIGSNYYLWTQSTDYGTIKVFISTDCINWTDKGTQLAKGSSGWDLLYTYWGRVFEDTPGHWVMTYTGVQTGVTTDCRIGYATLDADIPMLDGLTKWNTEGTPAIVSEELVLEDNDRVYPLTTNRYGYNHAFKVSVKANEQDSVFIRATPDSTNTNSLTIYNSDSISNNVFTDLTTMSAKAGVSNIVTTGGQSDFRTAFRTYEIQRISGNASYYQDDVLIRSETNATYLPTVDLGIMLQVWDSSQESTLWCDWAFIRKYVANPPTYEFGAEQSVPGHPTMKRWGGIPGMQYTGRRSW